MPGIFKSSKCNNRKGKKKSSTYRCLSFRNYNRTMVPNSNGIRPWIEIDKNDCHHANKTATQVPPTESVYLSRNPWTLKSATGDDYRQSKVRTTIPGFQEILGKKTRENLQHTYITHLSPHFTDFRYHFDFRKPLY
jgi:hypothetical protein